MFNYNIKDLKLKNMAREDGIFSVESEVSLEDKIAFVDSFQNGALSYIIALVKKFEADQDKLKKDSHGRVKTVSLQAWLKKNDTRGVAWSWSERCGLIEFMGLSRNIRYFNYGRGKHGWTADFVDSCFHTQLERCLIAEQQYYNEHNTDQQLIKKVCAALHNYGYPEHYCFSIGGDDHIVTDRSYTTNEYSIKVSLPKEDRALTIEEVKNLEAALTPVEEKYQQLMKAQSEMKEALVKAGLNFASSLKGER